MQVFSLSFLDCICCGFGAIILLLVLSKIYEPVIIEKTQDDLESLIAMLQQELFEIRGETEVMNRALGKVQLETSDTKMHLRTLQTIRDIAADPSEKIVLFIPSDLSGSISSLLSEQKKKE